ncbi:MAG: hypothetical protein HC802_22590 [Caldilineaceae bacterium]|nr:hypothetical protein [Caldilineaceae bacterium]
MYFLFRTPMTPFGQPGPEGLFRVQNGELEPVAQPQQHLYCCCAIHDRVLVGGAPFGVAFSLEDGENWQAGWFDDVDAPVLCLAADPNVETSGVILAGTDGAGLLRSTNRGRHWYTRNFGLHSYNVLALAWAPPAPENVWPRWQMVFACTEEGVYFSPNGGRGWKRAEGAEGVFQTLAVAKDYHTSGIVLAGTEEAGLWRSADGGHSFEAVDASPRQVNALAATAGGWLLSDPEQVWRSDDGLTWTPLSDSRPALVIQQVGDQLWSGDENGVSKLALLAMA